ncbi:MAG TPA: DbpA RNA binding domain-containing protein [Gemmatimonadales bacterium]
MSDSDLLSLAPTVAGTLAAAGWAADHPALREAAPVAARGHNLVFLAPPSPAWAAPVLGGVISRLLNERRGPVLGLASEAAVDEWARVAGQVALNTGIRVAAAHGTARVTRLLRAGTTDLVFLTPHTALELVRRSALKMDAVDGILLLSPEAWGGEDLLPGLLQDTGREIQRIVVTADRDAAAPLVERYCWKAPVVDLLEPATAPLPQIRTASTGWRRRAEALGDLVQQLDPESVTVWAADLSDRTLLDATLRAAGADPVVTSGIPEGRSLVIAWDLPTPTLLAAFAAHGEVILLVPPGAEAYLARVAPRRRALPLGGQLERARVALEQDRMLVRAVLDRTPDDSAFHAVAPLLERYESSAVAAALYRLWSEARTPPLEPASARPSGGESKLWIGIGKRDAVTPHDLVAALIKDAGVPKEAVGKVEIRESFTLVELGAGADAAAAAERLTGKTIRKRRLVARLDRGRTSGQ